MGDHSATREIQTETYVVPVSVSRLADHWGLVLTYGVLTFGLGIALILWPEESVKIFTILIAIQLIIAGIFRLVSAVAMSRVDGGMRALVGLSGGVALIVGLLVLREPLQSVVVLALVLGAWWVIAGVIDIIGAFINPGPSGRGWDSLGGVISILAGGFLLVYTEMSLHLLVVFVAFWLILAGLLAITAALNLRSAKAAS